MNNDILSTVILISIYLLVFWSLAYFCFKCDNKKITNDNYINEV